MKQINKRDVVMAKSLKVKEITKDYVKVIGTEVVNKFGGSYQTYQTLGTSWRYKMAYKPEMEKFVFDKTKLFLRAEVDTRYLNDFNMMYKVCNKMATYISKYTKKKSPTLTDEDAQKAALNKIFFDFNLFVSKFKKKYSKPMSNIAPVHVGVLEMAKHLRYIQK